MSNVKTTKIVAWQHCEIVELTTNIPSSTYSHNPQILTFYPAPLPPTTVLRHHLEVVVPDADQEAVDAFVGLAHHQVCENDHPLGVNGAVRDPVLLGQRGRSVDDKLICKGRRQNYKHMYKCTH